MSHSSKILSTHHVGEFRVDFFLTRFGTRVWFVLDFETSGHRVAVQGSIADAIAFLRRAIR